MLFLPNKLIRVCVYYNRQKVKIPYLFFNIDGFSNNKRAKESKLLDVLKVLRHTCKN